MAWLFDCIPTTHSARDGHAHVVVAIPQPPITIAL